jgi:phosphatidate cytidylyltransferase
MSLKRWLTALVALPLLFVVIRYGGVLAFTGLVLIIAILGLWEYYAMVLTPGQRTFGWAGLAAGFLLLGGVSLYGIQALPGIIAFLFMGIAIVLLLRFGKGDAVSDSLTRLVCGVIYIPFLLAHLVLIRNHDDGVVWIFFVLAVVFALDTSAYYVGTYAGRHKLYPAVSPKKTWEGTIGGLIGALSAACLFKICCFPDISWLHLVALALFMGIFGGIGDLAESMIKRSVHVKDSGILLPGHGGVLDRIDSLLFVAPIVYYYKELFIR